MKKGIKYLLIMVSILLLWQTPLIQPLKIFSSFLHQIGHFLIAVAFSYKLNDFRINFVECSYTLLYPKSWISQFAIANAGYIGSFFFSLVIFYLQGTYVRKYLLSCIAIVFVIIADVYAGISLPLYYAAMFAMAVLIFNMIGNDKLNDWVLDIVGIAIVSSALYENLVNTIFYEINSHFTFYDWHSTRQITDSVKLQDLTGIPSFIWGIIWVAIIVTIVYLFFSKSEKTSSES